MRYPAQRQGLVRAQRCLFTLALACGALLASSSTAHAQQLPTVQVESSSPATLFENTCVSPPRVQITPGKVVLSRTGTGNGALSVAYDATGPVETTSGSVDFAAGATTATISVVPTTAPLTSAVHQIDVRVLGGAGYDVGTPAVAHVDVAIAVPTCATSTTILPIIAPIAVTPLSGPPGTAVSVRGSGCRYGAQPTSVVVSLSPIHGPSGRPTSSARPPVDSHGQWIAHLVVPVGADPSDAYSVKATCSYVASTIFYYQTVSFDVTAPVAKPGVVTQGTPGRATRALPRTGGSGSTALAAAAVVLIAIGSLLARPRRRRRSS